MGWEMPYPIDLYDSPDRSVRNDVNRGSRSGSQSEENEGPPLGSGVNTSYGHVLVFPQAPIVDQLTHVRYADPAVTLCGHRYAIPARALRANRGQEVLAWLNCSSPARAPRREPRQEGATTVRRWHLSGYLEGGVE